MKRYLIALFAFIPFTVVAQEYITIDSSSLNCYYLYEFQVDSTNRNSLKSQEMILQIGKQYSNFISVNSLYKDSLLFVYKDEPPAVASGKIIPLVLGSPTHPFCNYQVLKNYPENNIVTTSSYLNKEHLVVIETQNSNWQLIAQVDTIINGYTCKPAKLNFAGRNYLAWYTLDIPISSGPYKFGGLPGLIISISDTQNQHKFEILEIKNLKRAQPIYYLKYESLNISPQDFVKALHLKTNRMYNRIQQNDRIQTDSDETKARALNKLKSRNNFIERY